MKKRITGFISLFLFLFLFVLLTTCQKENPEPRDYPRFKEALVTNITDSGAIFSTNLYSLGKETIEQTGFVWGLSNTLNINEDNRIYLGVPSGVGIITADIKSVLRVGAKYYMSPFVKTEKRIVYGPVVEFTSLGSKAPVIYSFKPDSAGWGDTIKISGKYFSYKLNRNVVKIGNITCNVYGSTDTSIFIQVSPEIQTIQNVLSIDIEGNTFIYNKKAFQLILPSIKDFFPKQAYWGDSIFMKGQKLTWLIKKPGSFINIGAQKCEYSNLTDTSVSIMIPFEINNISNELTMFINNILINAPQSFTLLPPVFTFSPENGTWGNNVTLSGRFNKLSSRNKVFFNGLQANIISSSEKVIIVQIPNSLSDLKSVIKYSAQPFEINSLDTFRLSPPLLSSFAPEEGVWGSTITFTGNFNPVLSNNKIFFNNKEAVNISSTSNSLTVKVPNSVSDLKSKIVLSVNSLSISAMDSFSLIPPVISSFLPKEGTWNDQITLNGVFNPDPSLDKIFVDDISATIASVTPTSIKVYVPPSLSSIKSKIINKVNSFNVATIDSFQLFQPVIESFTPTSGPSGTAVTIKGKYFGKGSFIGVKFGMTSANFSTIDNSTLVTTVPTGISGPVKITVSQPLSAISATDFDIITPVIDNISPGTGTFNDEITIDGTNFIIGGVNATVKFGTIPAVIKSITNNRIIAYVPNSIDSISRKVSVTISSSVASSSQDFVLIPPEIFMVEPNSFTQNDTITITGSGFCPVASLNSVSIGGYEMIVSRSNPSVIKVSPPNYLPRGFYSGLSIKVGGFKRTYPLSNDFKSYWAGIRLPDTFSWNTQPGFLATGVAFSSNNLGYMMDFSQAQMTSYNSLTNEFVNLGKFSFQAIFGLVSTVNRDTAYLAAEDIGLFRYNSVPNTITRISSLPINANGFLFSLNGKLYFGFTFWSSYYLKLWSYDSKFNLWREVGNCPPYSLSYVNTIFTIKNRAYILFRNNVFCVFNSDDNTFTKLTSFPGMGTTRMASISFAINDLGYVGLGCDEYSFNQTYYDIWQYNPEYDTWIQSSSMPAGGRYNSISFVLNNKAYLGFGYKSNLKYNDFYEFDPNYPVK